MGRPRIIQLDQGKVSIQDFTPETSTALVEHIKAFFEPKPIFIPATSGVEVPGYKTAPVNPDTLQDTALAVKMDKKNLKVFLVETKYNLETKEALVTHVEEFDNAKDASVKFKIKASLLNFV